MDLSEKENELKKRLNYPYQWGRKQNDEWDEATHFIYTTNKFDDLLKTIENKFEKFQNKEELKNYAMNRWFNFFSAQAVEEIFCSTKFIKPNKDKKNKLIDFTLNEFHFDHKTTVFPKAFNKDINYAKANERELIEWLYENQSQQGRKHMMNRLFVVVYDSNNPDHWKLKAELSWLKKIIYDYIEIFDENNLVRLSLTKDRKTLSDIIWAIK